MRELLRRKGLTQQHAADLLGLSLSSIAKRCAGAVPVRAGELLALETLADKEKPAGVVRRFRNVGGFDDGTKWLEFSPDGKVNGFYSGKNHDFTGCYELKTALRYVREGHWEEITDKERNGK